MTHSREAFWWSLFSAGGVLSALFLPILILLTGFILPFSGAASGERYQRVVAYAGWWPVQVLLIAVISLSFFHCAHRIRHVMMDVGLHAASGALGVVCYSAALAGSIAAGFVVFSL
jgi:fumarate reductase subunit D